MNCEEARAAMERREDGDLEAGTAALLDRHLTDCPACVAWHAASRALVGDIRDALAPFDRPGAWRDHVLAASRDAPAEAPPDVPSRNSAPRHSSVGAARRSWRSAARWAWVPAAAAAVALLCARTPRPAPVGRLLDGSLTTGERALRPGTRYEARTGGTVAIGGDLHAVLAPGTRFAVGARSLRVESGGGYVQSAVKDANGAWPGLAVVAGGIRAELSVATRLYVHAPEAPADSPSVEQALGALRDVLTPRAHAENESGPLPADDGFLLVFAGRATVSHGDAIAWVAAGQGFFPDLPGHEVQSVRAYADRLALAVERNSQPLDGMIERYRRTIAAYDEDLVAKRGRRTVSSPAETEELEIRIALVDRVRTAHQERLRSLLLDRQSMMADAPRARLVERLRRIREAQAGDAGAVASLKATP